MLCRRLERKGYLVIGAEDGEQGYSLAQLEKPDLVLMDISLPGMDGWQVAELLKSNDASSLHIDQITRISGSEVTYLPALRRFSSPPLDASGTSSPSAVARSIW